MAFKQALKSVELEPSLKRKRGFASLGHNMMRIKYLLGVVHNQHRRSRNSILIKFKLRLFPGRQLCWRASTFDVCGWLLVTTALRTAANFKYGIIIESRTRARRYCGLIIMCTSLNHSASVYLVRV